MGKQINKASFLGKSFKIFAGRKPGHLGGATARNVKRRALFLDDRLRGGLLMEVALHEALHACFDKRLGEKDVTNAAIAITRFLYRVGDDPRWKGRRKK